MQSTFIFYLSPFLVRWVSLKEVRFVLSVSQRLLILIKLFFNNLNYYEMGKARSGTLTTTVKTGLTALILPFKSVFFSKRQILALIDNANNPDQIEGIMLRPKESGSVYETLDAIKVTESMFSKLKDYIPDTQIPTKKGKPLEKGIPPTFQGLDMFGFAFFPISTIEAMLSVIQASDPDKSGLIFRLVVVELDALAENKRHLSLAVSPNTVNNPIVGEDGKGIDFMTTPVNEFLTYSIGFVCPPIWPPNYLKLMQEIGVPNSMISRLLTRAI
jgi:hypothetical protein